MTIVADIAKRLGAVTDQEGDNLFEVKLIENEGQSSYVSVKRSFDELSLPVNVSANDEQIRCIIKLVTVNEVQESLRAKLNEELLRFGVVAPLSSVGIVDDSYVVYGSLSSQSSDKELIEEIKALIANADIVLDELQDFVKK